jgi:asparagine synthetase B (glutamine-hydrolysing)
MAARVQRQRQRPAAEELHADHSIVRTEPTSDDVERFFAAMDRLSVDGLNAYLACQAVASHGLKVVLSGAGGDEVLGGGCRHHRLGWLVRASPSALRVAIAAMATRDSWMQLAPEKAMSGMMSVGWPTDVGSLVAFARTLRHDRETTRRILDLSPLPRFDESSMWAIHLTATSRVLKSLTSTVGSRGWVAVCGSGNEMDSPLIY